MKAFLLVATLLGCAVGTAPHPGGPMMWAERVQRYDGCTELSTCWRFAPYYRLADPVGVPGWWVISIQGHACLIDPGPTAAQPIVGELWECAWRLPRA